MTLENLYCDFMKYLTEETLDIPTISVVCYQFLIKLENYVKPVNIDTEDLVDIIRSFNDMSIRKNLNSKCNQFISFLNITDNDLLSPEIVNVAIALQLYYPENEI